MEKIKCRKGRDILVMLVKFCGTCSAVDGDVCGSTESISYCGNSLPAGSPSSPQIVVTHT